MKKNSIKNPALQRQEFKRTQQYWKQDNNADFRMDRMRKRSISAKKEEER
jgi:hypothetical protein